MVENASGFAVSQYDLEHRGPGDFFGTRQSGKMLTDIKNLRYPTSVIFMAKRLSDDAFESGLAGQELREAALRKYESLKIRQKENEKKENEKKGEATRKNIQRQKRKVQKLYHRLECIRTDYVNKSVKEVVKAKPYFITIEDLNVSGMMKNKHLSKAIAEQKFYEFRVKCMFVATFYKKKFFYNITSITSLLCAVIFFAYPGAGFNDVYILFENVYSISTHALLLITSITMITLKAVDFKYVREKESMIYEMITLAGIFA